MLALRDNEPTRIHTEKQRKGTQDSKLKVLWRKHSQPNSPDIRKEEWPQWKFNIRKRRSIDKAPIKHNTFHNVNIELKPISWAEVQYRRNSYDFSANKMNNIINNCGELISHHKNYHLIKDVDVSKMQPWDIFKMIIRFIKNNVTKYEFDFEEDGTLLEYKVFREEMANFEWYDVKDVMDSKNIPKELKNVFLNVVRLLTEKMDLLLWDDVVEMEKDMFESEDRTEEEIIEDYGKNPLEEYNNSDAEKMFSEFTKPADMKLLRNYAKKHEKTKHWGIKKMLGKIVHFALKVAETNVNPSHFEYYKDIVGVQDSEAMSIQRCYRFIWDGELEFIDRAREEFNDLIGNYGQMAWVNYRIIDSSNINDNLVIHDDYSRNYEILIDGITKFFNEFVYVKEKS